MDDVRWLDGPEQQAWRSLVSGMTALERQLERELVLDQITRPEFLAVGRAMQAAYRAASADGAPDAYRA